MSKGRGQRGTRGSKGVQGKGNGWAENNSRGKSGSRVGRADKGEVGVVGR